MSYKGYFLHAPKNRLSCFYDLFIKIMGSYLSPVFGLISKANQRISINLGKFHFHSTNPNLGEVTRVPRRITQTYFPTAETFSPTDPVSVILCLH
jgi:hypothetical protein